MNRCHGLLGPQNGSDLPSALGLVGNTVANQHIYFITGDDKCEFGLVWWKSKSKKCNSICKKAHNNYSQHISLQNPREKEEDAAMVMFALSSRASRPSSQRTRWALRGRYWDIVPSSQFIVRSHERGRLKMSVGEQPRWLMIVASKGRSVHI